MADAGSPNATAATIASRRHARVGASADASVSPANAWANGDGIRTYVPERSYQRRVAAAADFRLKAEATSAPRPRSPHAPRTPHLCPLPRPHPQALFPLPDTSPRTSHLCPPPGPRSFAPHLNPPFALRTSALSPYRIPRPSFLCPRARTSSSVTTLVR